MKNILQIDLPWFILRSNFVKEDLQGVLYNTMFQEYITNNTIFEKVFEKKNYSIDNKIFIF